MAKDADSVKACLERHPGLPFGGPGVQYSVVSCWGELITG